MGDDLCRIGGGAGGKDEIRTGVDGVLDVSGEVGGALRELLAGHGAAQVLKGVDKIGGKAGAVVLAQHTQHIGIGCTELILCKVCHDRALERVQEADTEIIGVRLGDGGVGAGAADGGDGSRLEGGRCGNGNAGAVAAQHHRHLFGDQLLCCGNGLIGAGLVVYLHQLHVVGLAADVHGGGYAVGVLDAQHLLLAAGTVVAGGRFKYADLYGLATGAARAARRTAGQCSRCCGSTGYFQKIAAGNKSLHHKFLLNAAVWAACFPFL